MKVGIITQARMNSTRLPGKVLLNVHGKSMLQYHLERINATGFQVIVATTTQSSDDQIVAACEKMDIAFFRGSEENVLDRYYRAATHFHLDVIVRVTSDCPFLDSQLVQDGIGDYLSFNDNNLYFSTGLDNTTFPNGIGFEIFSKELLDLAHKNATLSEDLEHVTPYMHQNRSGNVKLIDFMKPEDYSHLRVTLDTPEDFKLIERLITDHKAELLNYSELMKLLTDTPSLIAINKEIKQKKFNE